MTDLHTDRSTFLGASDIAKAASGRYGGATSVVAEKLGIATSDISDDLADRGHRWELAIADGVHAHTGLWVVGEQMRLSHKTRPHHQCTADGLLAATAEASLDQIIAGNETKTRGRFAPWAWDYWRPQCQWSMYVTGLPRWLLAIGTIDTDYDTTTGLSTEQLTSVHYEWINADTYEQDRLVAVADELWAHVEAGTLPEPTGPEALPYVKSANQAADPKATADIDDLADLIERREAIRAAIKATEDEAATIEAQIRARLGAATEAVTTDGRWRIRCGLPIRKFTSRSEADFLELYAAQAAELGLIRTVEHLDRDRARELMGTEYDALRCETPDRRLTVKDLRPEETQ